MKRVAAAPGWIRRSFAARQLEAAATATATDCAEAICKPARDWLSSAPRW